MRDLDKLKSKLEITLEMRIPVNISMVCNHCKNLLKEKYRPAILLSESVEYYFIASEISTNNYQDIIKYHDL